MGVDKFYRRLVLNNVLAFAQPVSKIIPGATSLSLRNNADSADNLIVTDAGAATVRAGLTVTAGGVTVTAGGANVTAGGVVVAAGGVTQGAAGGAGSSVTIVKTITVTDNTATDIATVTIPNAIHGAAIRVTAMGVLGDGDSADSKVYMIGVSRIAGAATKAVASTATAVGATTGATANATLTISVTGMTGAVGATQTFTIQGKVARSAGAADNHAIVAEIVLLNAKATGVTVA